MKACGPFLPPLSIVVRLRLTRTHLKSADLSLYNHFLIRLATVMALSQIAAVSTLIKNATTVHDVIALANDWKRHPKIRRWVKLVDLIMPEPAAAVGSKGSWSERADCCRSRGRKLLGPIFEKQSFDHQLRKTYRQWPLRAL